MRNEFSLDGKTYSHDLLTAEALEFIDKSKESPFFLYLPYCIPHTKFQVPDLGEYAETDWKPNHKTHAAMITRMDRDIGRLLKKIKESGIDDNTLVMFTSDHGAHGQSGTAKHFQSSGKLRGVKRSLYEGGIRVPLIARWPGKIKPKSQSDHVSAFWDMMPTLADLAGTETKTKHDGISFVPELLGTGNQETHKSLYWELFEYGKHNRAVRMGKWKGVIANFYKSSKMELYDLVNDPEETKNVADQHPEIVKKLSDEVAMARTRSELWNVESKGFNLKAACEATGIPMPRTKNKRKNK